VTLFDDPPRLRQPEYTGENRCTPCTVVNTLIAGSVGVVLGVVVHPAAGVLAFGAGALAVYLRGYLVPGTPALTRRYFPPWLLRTFGKDPIKAAATGTTRRADEPPEAVADAKADADTPLVAAGVVSDGQQPTPTEAFREEWRARIDAIDEVTPEAVADVFGADSARRLGEASFVLDESASVRWGSEGALVADVAAAGLLAERLGARAEWDRDTRRSVLMGLRLCLETCPSCGGAVRLEEDRVDPCCQKPHLVAEAVCTDCGAVLGDTAVVDDDGTTSVSATLLEP
jgi:hypothetical protein